MRRFAVIALLGLAGCIGDDSASPGGEDAGTLPGADGSTPTPGTDAAPTDATLSDAPVADAPAPPAEAAIDAPDDTTPPPVSITAIDGNTGLPEPGVTIVFSDATGGIVGTATTGVTGTAAMLLASGGMVTAGFGTPANPAFVTIVGVEPGDALTAIDTSLIVTQQVELESIPPAPDGGVHYTVMAGGPSPGSTGFTSTPVGLTIEPASQLESKTSLLLTVADVDYDSLPYYAAQKGVSLVSDGGTTPVAIGGSFTSASVTQTVTAQSYPATDNGWLVMSELAAGFPFSSGQNADFSTPDGGEVGLPFTVRTALADEIQCEATVATYGDGPATSSAIATRGPVPADGGTTTFDLSTLLPQLSLGSADLTDPQRPIVAWGTDAGSLASADGVYVAMEWNTSTYNGGSWSFVVPPTASQVQAPALPGSLAAWLPDPDGGASSWDQTPQIGVVEATFVTSYAQLRATFANFPTTALYVINGYPTIPPLPADGTLRLTQFTGNAD